MGPMRRYEAGATAVEYAIMAAAIAAVIVAVVWALGGQTCEALRSTPKALAAERGAPAPVECL